MRDTPIAVFVYNRPEHTSNMLQSLAACERLEECDIFIYSDAARIPEHAEKVKNVRQLIHKWGANRNVQIFERSQNWGLSRSIVDGVTELCERYGRVVVVEDDLVLHPKFIHYMLTALGHYENVEQIAQISGYMFPLSTVPERDTFFLPLTTTWGWATWRRVWEMFDPTGLDARFILENKSCHKSFNFGGSAPFSEMLAERLAGKNQSWGVLFYAMLFREHKVSIFPRFSLVRNDGRDDSGFHRGKLLEEHAAVINEAFSSDTNSANFPESFPDVIVVAEDDYRRVQSYLSSFHRAYHPSHMRKIFRYIKRVLNEFTRKTPE